MKKISFFRSLLFAALLLAPTGASAQVTIGNGKVPESFSVLELISNQKQGLRLPHLTTAERDAVQATFGSLATTEAEGLQIFNTDTKCVETWNGSIWIGQCAPPVRCSAMAGSYNFCDTDNATIATLNTKVGNVLQWYAAETGGTALAVNTVLESKLYYAEGCLDADGQPNTARVAVNVVACNVAPVAANNMITAFTNVMYDFQTQELEAYTSGGGGAAAWQWQVSKTRTDGYEDIAGATAATFKVPAHFIDGYAGAVNDELFFKCEMTNPKGSALTTDANALGIEFIKTNTAGYGGIGTANPYLTIGKGANGDNTGASGSIKISLLNLGQGEGDDAGDLGDFYQWGRVADGHEHIVWSKNTVNLTRPNEITTSGTETRANSLVGSLSGALTASGQIPNDGAAGYGKFITDDGGFWGNGALNLWGNGLNYTTRASDIPLSSWTYVANNPCQALGAGWYVPSVWNFTDMYDGNGVGGKSSSNYIGTDNSWRWRSFSANNVIGGVIITNAAGEKVFLPATGRRLNTSAGRSSITEGYYLSHNNDASSLTLSQGLRFSGGSVSTVRQYLLPYSVGASVRCVAE